MFQIYHQSHQHTFLLFLQNSNLQHSVHFLKILENQTLRESHAMERVTSDKLTPEYNLCGGTAGNRTWVQSVSLMP